MDHGNALALGGTGTRIEHSEFTHCATGHISIPTRKWIPAVRTNPDALEESVGQSVSDETHVVIVHLKSVLPRPRTVRM